MPPCLNLYVRASIIDALHDAIVTTSYVNVYVVVLIISSCLLWATIYSYCGGSRLIISFRVCGRSISSIYSKPPLLVCVPVASINIWIINDCCSWGTSSSPIELNSLWRFSGRWYYSRSKEHIIKVIINNLYLTRLLCLLFSSPCGAQHPEEDMRTIAQRPAIGSFLRDAWLLFGFASHPHKS